MIDAMTSLQWLKSYIRGLRDGLGETEFEEDWLRGATWAINKLDDQINVLAGYIDLHGDKNNGDS